MSDFMQTVYKVLPYFYIAVYAALAVISFLRLRITVAGIILGTGFAARALFLVIRLLIQSWMLTNQANDSPSRVAFNLGFGFIIPMLLDILIIIGIVMIPRSLRQLARTPAAPGTWY